MLKIKIDKSKNMLNIKYVLKNDNVSSYDNTAK